MNDLNVVGFLWKGEGLPTYSQEAYDLRYVVNLHRGIKNCLPGGRLTMMVDDFYFNEIMRYSIGDHGQDVAGIELVKFAGHGIGGWSNVLEAFRPDLNLGERTLLVGLDTVFVNDFSWLFGWDHAPVGVPRDPYHPKTVCDAVIAFGAEGKKIVWDFFKHEAGRNRMRDHLLAGKPSEMMLLRALVTKHGWTNIDETHPDQLLSYKVHIIGKKKKPFEKASIVYFHGKPKPADLPEDSPIHRIWEGARLNP